MKGTSWGPPSSLQHPTAHTRRKVEKRVSKTNHAQHRAPARPSARRFQQAPTAEGYLLCLWGKYYMSTFKTMLKEE